MGGLPAPRAQKNAPHELSMLTQTISEDLASFTLTVPVTSTLMSGLNTIDSRGALRSAAGPMVACYSTTDTSR